MRPTRQRLKKQRNVQGLVLNRCRKRSVKLFSRSQLLLFLILLRLLDLVVHLGPCSLISRIFGPKGDTRQLMSTPSKLSTCVFDAANADIGPVPVLSLRTSQTLNNPAVEDCWEIEQGVHYSGIFHGKLRSCLFARVFRPFKITLMTYSIKNRSSAKRRDGFVREAISELLACGCVREVANYPAFCNPLSVAVQSSGKLRLNLDLFHSIPLSSRNPLSTQICDVCFKCFPAALVTVAAFLGTNT